MYNKILIKNTLRKSSEPNIIEPQKLNQGKHKYLITRLLIIKEVPNVFIFFLYRVFSFQILDNKSFEIIIIIKKKKPLEIGFALSIRTFQLFSDEQ